MRRASTGEPLAPYAADCAEVELPGNCSRPRMRMGARCKRYLRRNVYNVAQGLCGDCRDEHLGDVYCSVRPKSQC
eukprot:528315-Alexandrium_andersonii.AAC.1